MKKGKKVPLRLTGVIFVILFVGVLGRKDYFQAKETSLFKETMEISLAQSSNTTLIRDDANAISDVQDALTKAKQTKNDVDIVDLKIKVESLSSEWIKSRVKEEIKLLEEEKEQDRLFETLEEELNAISKTLKESDLKNIKSRVNDLTNLVQKQKLQEEITSIEQKIKNQKEEQRRKEEEEQRRIESLYQVTLPKKVEVLETIRGSISAYSPYCEGCVGFTAYGNDVRKNIYYQDKTYGNIRIVAGDNSYPFGTIVRFKKLNGEDLYAIVLDRGGVIGKGKLRLFDLLFATETAAYQFGVAYDIKCEILRYGF